MRTYTMTLVSLVALVSLLGCGGNVELFDFDNDGVMDSDDCDPENPDVFPGNPEVCDCLDNDCDGVVDEGLPNCNPDCDDPGDDDDDDATGDDDTTGDDDDDTTLVDEDGDGWTPQDGDCNDHDPDVHPGADEVCDGVDTNCDGLDDSEDADNDGFTPCDGDCDDTQPSLNPNATDLVGDGVDQNCDGIDGTDSDGDGHASELSGGEDCDDADNSIFPGAVEVWYDGIAQDCDDWGDPLWSDGDQDGDGYDWDGIGGDDCVDTNPDAYPGAHEDNTDGVDNNCNGITDGFHVTMTWTPGLTWQDIQDDPATVVMSLHIEDLVDSHSLEFDVINDGDPSYAYNFFTYYGTTLDEDLWSSDLGYDGCIGPASTQTYMLNLYTGVCYVWGYDPAVLDPTNYCRWEDPTLY